MDAKQVQFNPTAKQHDGPKPIMQLLEDVTYAYFDQTKITCMQDMREFVATRWSNYGDVSKQAVGELIVYVHLQLRRASQLGSSTRIPLLREGGGRGLTMGRTHLAHFRRMVQYLITCLVEKSEATDLIE